MTDNKGLGLIEIVIVLALAGLVIAGLVRFI